MAYQHLNWAYSLKTLKGPAKPILVALADQADSDATCWPGQQLLADMTGVSIKTVERACQRLERLGLIERTRRHTSTGHRTSDRFYLQVDVTPEDLDKALAEEGTQDLTDTAPTRQRALKAESLEDTQSGLPDTESGQVEVPSTDPPETPQVSPKAPTALAVQSEPAKAKRPPRGSELDPDNAPAGTRFEDFWATYPRHDDRRRAENAWKAARRRADSAAIIGGAATYRDDPNREQQFTKQPATWLNADAWANDPLPARAGRAPENAVDRRRRQVAEARAALAARDTAKPNTGEISA